MIACLLVRVVTKYDSHLLVVPLDRSSEGSKRQQMNGELLAPKKPERFAKGVNPNRKSEVLPGSGD